eukprot:Skav219508  [mRNA]  locus=scaffold3561:50327:51124:+ [translate_table: standard]
MPLHWFSFAATMAALAAMMPSPAYGPSPSPAYAPTPSPLAPSPVPPVTPAHDAKCTTVGAAAGGWSEADVTGGC